MAKSLTLLRSCYLEIGSIKNNTKGRLFLLALRLCQLSLRFPIALVPFTYLVEWLYTVIIRWVLGIDIPLRTRIGFGLNVFHGIGLIVHENTIIGSNVTLHHNSTIGVAHKNGNPPTIGDDVIIGANSVVIGEITVGNGSIIAAGSVVVKSVPRNTIVAGNPARVIKELTK